jgi:hypothetical protein
VLTSLRTLAIAAISSFGLVLYLALWFRLPITLSLGAGALMAMLVVMTSASLGADPAKADTAWRDAAPDLQDEAPGPEASAPSPAAATAKVAVPVVAGEPLDADGAADQIPAPAPDGASG